MRGSWSPNKDCNILTPQLFWLSSPFFPILLGCSTRGQWVQPLLGHDSHSSIFSPTDLNFLSPGLYNNLMPTYFLRASQFALNSTPWQSRSPPDIFNRMHLLFTQVHFFFWQLGQIQSERVHTYLSSVGGPFVCIRVTVGEHTWGRWQICLSVQQVSPSVQNYRPYIVFQLPHGNMNMPLQPRIFCLWLVIGTYILLFFFSGNLLILSVNGNICHSIHRQ